ncbi:MAG TPA: lysophospholipid acyltransferase family protein, partial [Alkalispirochaeta sp.]|nr:lysophospholipid acyltransferase family protein [Alkalispirochaeta sp.]
LLLAGFTNSTVRGSEHFPRSGPFIVAGNHRGIMELLLMVAICPRNIEVLGAGDIPLDPRYRYLADFYGYIPYKRGQMDRPALQTAQRVLERGGVVGIFPEGGIWKSGRKTAHRGVAWLSFVTGAPIVPVGFGGVYRAVERAVRLEKPHLETWVGRPIYPPTADPNVPRRVRMERHAEHILDWIEELIPEWDRAGHVAPLFEEYCLEVWASDESGTPTDRSGEIDHAEELSAFFHLPVLVDVLYSNLNRRRVRPFREFGRIYPVSQVHYAITVILGYVIRTNPAFLPYRLGDATAEAVVAGLWSFRALCQTIMAESGGDSPIRVVPRYRYQMPGDTTPTERTEPPPLRRF